MLRDYLRLTKKELDEKIAVAEETNRKKQEYKEAWLSSKEDYDTLIENINLMLLVKDITCRKANEFRESRLSELIDRTEAVLDLAFPQENFGIKILSDRKYNEDIAGILVGRKGTPESQWFSPLTENGGFVQQLISASTIVSICLMLNADFIFLDEMFCSGDPVSVANIAPFFKNIIDNNIQLLIIEHKPSLYESIDRREIHLAKDREVKQNVRLLEVKDLKGDSTVEYTTIE